MAAEIGSAVAAAATAAMTVAGKKQKLRGQETINKMRQRSWQWQLWQHGCNGRQRQLHGRSDNNESSSISDNSVGEFIPPFFFGHGKVECCKIEGRRRNGRRR
jgi:hypothetical protein